MAAAGGPISDCPPQLASLMGKVGPFLVIRIVRTLQGRVRTLLRSSVHHNCGWERGPNTHILHKYTLVTSSNIGTFYDIINTTGH